MHSCKQQPRLDHSAWPKKCLKITRHILHRPRRPSTYVVIIPQASYGICCRVHGTRSLALRGLQRVRDATTPPDFPPAVGHDGYVSNWTTSESACEVPYIRNLHDIFINSHNSSHLHWKRPGDPDRLITRQFFPLFSSAKLAGTNNDILVPPATSFDGLYFSDDSKTWTEKKETVFWKGEATGGIPNDSIWSHFHRHRLVSMCNATQVEMTRKSPQPPAHVPGGNPPLAYNIFLANSATHSLAVRPLDLPAWISSWSDVAYRT